MLVGVVEYRDITGGLREIKNIRFYEYDDLPSKETVLVSFTDSEGWHIAPKWRKNRVNKIFWGAWMVTQINNGTMPDKWEVFDDADEDATEYWQGERMVMKLPNFMLKNEALLTAAMALVGLSEILVQAGFKSDDHKEWATMLGLLAKEVSKDG